MGRIHGRGDNLDIYQITTAIFWYQDVLRPLMLVYNYPAAGYRLPKIEIDAMQNLVKWGDVQMLEWMHIVRVLWIQLRVCAFKLGNIYASYPGTGGG